MFSNLMISIKLAFYLFSLASFLAGVFLAVKPLLAIKLQIKFYEKINWRVEPISMAKEIRNTRAMGVFLLVLFFCYVFYSISQRIIP